MSTSKDVCVDALMHRLSESSDHRIFNSEADFQFSLAWAIKEKYPKFEVRLEEVFNSRPDQHVDIVLHSGKYIIPIELKYCTKPLPKNNTSGVVLKNQGAEDLRRYDFIKDISRIEQLRDDPDPEYDFMCGYAIFLTNSNHYWSARKSWEDCIDQAFRIHQDKGTLGGNDLHWDNDASAGTMKGRETPLSTDVYKIDWKHYLNDPDPEFQYLSIRVA